MELPEGGERPGTVRQLDEPPPGLPEHGGVVRDPFERSGDRPWARAGLAPASSSRGGARASRWKGTTSLRAVDLVCRLRRPITGRLRAEVRTNCRPPRDGYAATIRPDPGQTFGEGDGTLVGEVTQRPDHAVFLRDDLGLTGPSARRPDSVPGAGRRGTVGRSARLAGPAEVGAQETSSEKMLGGLPPTPTVTVATGGCPSRRAPYGAATRPEGVVRRGFGRPVDSGTREFVSAVGGRATGRGAEVLRGRTRSSVGLASVIGDSTPRRTYIEFQFRLYKLL